MKLFVQSLKRCLETVQLVQQGQSCRFSSSEEFFLNLNPKKSTVVIFVCVFLFCRMKILNASLQLAFAMRIRFETLPHDLLANDSVTLSFDFYAAIQTSLSRHKGFWPQNCLFISCTLLMDKQQCLKHPHLNWKQNKALKLQVSTKAWFCQQCKMSSKMHSSTKSKQAADCHICRSGVLKIHSEQALLQGLFPKEKTATSFWENCRTSSSFEIPLHAFDGIGLQTRPHLLEIVLVQTHLLVICVLCFSKTFNYCCLLPVLFFRCLSSQGKLRKKENTSWHKYWRHLLTAAVFQHHQCIYHIIYCIHQSGRDKWERKLQGRKNL